MSRIVRELLVKRGTRIGLISGLAAVAAIMALALSWTEQWADPPLQRGRAAYARGDWSAAESLARRQLARGARDAEATRLRARSLARLGHDREALALELALGAERLEAEDLFLIGQALIRSGRTVLGWAALDAASKLDPKHRETASALSELHGHIEQLGPKVRLVDLLNSVASAPALAELVVGLVAASRPAADSRGFDPILDRVSQLGRAKLSKLDSPSAARKILARILLEDGRPAEARAWLDKVVEKAIDPEANWLLSRAYLDEGAIEKADEAVERAGSFGQQTPLEHEPARYVGAKRCAECHGVIYRAQQGSRHATTLAWGPALKSVPLPNSTVTDPANSKVSHRFESSGDGIKVESHVDGQSIRALIAYALGSGHHGMTMLAKDESGRYRTLRISYYTGGDYWGITSGFNPHPLEPERYLGERLTVEGFQECLNCHTTRFRSELDRNGAEAADKGIGCERCHGPGENHLKAVAAGFPQLAIARPKIATPAQRMVLCAQCHSADGQIPASDPRFIRFHATTLPNSRCVTESGGRLDCVGCHDPHRNVETNPAFYAARCLACHGVERPSEGDLKSLRLDPVEARRCPVNPAKDCLKCHMPKVENVMPYTTLTDHHIRIHP